MPGGCNERRKAIFGAEVTMEAEQPEIVYNTVGVLGSGSWATALTKLLSYKRPEVNWFMRNPNNVEHLRKYAHNPSYLREVSFDMDVVKPSSNVEEVVAKSDVIIVAIPSAFVHATLEGLTRDHFRNKVVFSAIKGIIPELQTIPARYFHKQYRIPYDNIGIICGPCHAEEVAMERLSYLTIGCMEETNARLLAGWLNNRFIRTTTTEDLFGAEIAAVLKNIYAIASGIYGGLGYGDNFQAVLMAASIRELERFIDKINPFHRDVKEAAYLGDLLVTAYSKFSRNRTFGYMLGKGYSVKAAQLEMDMVAEGYYAVKSIKAMNQKFGIEMPIADAVYNVIYERISPVVEMRLLADQLS